MQKICIVIPSYNEEKRLNIDEFFSFFDINPNIYFCFVNDGSTDNTIELLNSLKKNREDRILLVDLEENKGKAEAVRIGVLESNKWKTFDYIGFFDADFSTPLTELNYFESFKDNVFDYPVIIGSRIKRMGANIKRSATRHYIGRVFSTIASSILGLPIYDTQCGAKLINKEIVDFAFEEPFISKWLFDIEIFARIINKYGYQETNKMILEIPLNQWVEKGESKINKSYFFKIPIDLIRISKKYKLKIRISNL